MHTARSSRIRSALLAGVLFAPLPVAAQGTAADYTRADSFPARVQGTVVDAVDQTDWIGKTTRFWYRKSVKEQGGWTYLVVDAATKQKQPAFDQAKLAASLTAAMHRPVSQWKLPFFRLRFTDDGKAIEFFADTTLWRCTLADDACAIAPPDTAREGRGRREFGGGLYGSLPAELMRPRLSPDGKWEATIRNYNVYVSPVHHGRNGRGAGTRATRGAPSVSDSVSVSFYLSTDGSEGEYYDLASVVWSPNGKGLAAYRVRPGYRREVHYVRSSPEDQLQPEYSSRYYSKPGDVLDHDQPVLFDVAARKEIAVNDSLFPNAFDVSALAWRDDSRHVTFEYNQRGHQAYRVIEIDAATGATRAVIDEEMPTFFEYSAKKFRFDIADGKEIIWMSERDGWNHLYLYDGVTGKVKNQITKGPWVVREVEKVDTLKRQIWFTASGMNPGEDPYFVHAYRINFDGTGLTSFAKEPAQHTIAFSDDMQYYVDEYSRVDLPPVAELRRTSDDAVVMPLEKADASALYALGWKPPEVFTARGRDGATDIWGVIIRPTNFNPKTKYPVIENIYAGPQGSFVPKTFSPQTSMQALAELGFIVVQIDGMGTSNRSKAFHDVAWKNLGDAGFPDRILWHKAVAAKYPYYDISRVGIYGTSAGGQNSMGAVLFHPEFYKVAVSSAGCHDNRMDKIWWNEQWMGWPIGPQYSASSNVDNAWRLKGKLLLFVGEMDRNVDPSSTMQVVNALIKANKTFDLLVIPGADHTNGGPYGEEKRRDFFVHNLLGVEPPDRNVGPAVASANT